MYVACVRGMCTWRGNVYVAAPPPLVAPLVAARRQAHLPTLIPHPSSPLTQTPHAESPQKESARTVLPSSSTGSLSAWLSAWLSADAARAFDGDRQGEQAPKGEVSFAFRGR